MPLFMISYGLSITTYGLSIMIMQNKQIVKQLDVAFKSKIY